jgi:hypothetical protein
MSAPIPSTQKAWRVIQQGDPSQALRLDHNVPVPRKIPAGSVLVKIHASALNPGCVSNLKLP